MIVYLRNLMKFIIYKRGNEHFKETKFFGMISKQIFMDDIMPLGLLIVYWDETYWSIGSGKLSRRYFTFKADYNEYLCTA